MNGYLDNDGCADELARLMVQVVDSSDASISGLEVFIPGLENPHVTDTSGVVALFELMPGAVINITVRDPNTAKTSTGAMLLREGENQILVRVPWLPVTQPTSPQQP